MNVLGRIFLNFRKDRRKDGFFFVRYKRTYVLNKEKIFVKERTKKDFNQKLEWSKNESLVGGIVM